MVIPSSVTIIGAYAFSGCSSLASVVIPSSVTSIWDEAFRGCTELADVYCYAERVPRTVVDVFNGSPIESSTLHVLASAIDNYREAMPWSRFGKIVAIGNEDAVTQVKAVPMMIQAVGGALRIDGVQAGTPIDVYDLCGRLIANTMAIGNSTRVAVPTGEKMVVVKVGESREGQKMNGERLIINSLEIIVDISLFCSWSKRLILRRFFCALSSVPSWAKNRLDNNGRKMW